MKSHLTNRRRKKSEIITVTGTRKDNQTNKSGIKSKQKKINLKAKQPANKK